MDQIVITFDAAEKLRSFAEQNVAGRHLNLGRSPQIIKKCFDSQFLVSYFADFHSEWGKRKNRSTKTPHLQNSDSFVQNRITYICVKN